VQLIRAVSEQCSFSTKKEENMCQTRFFGAAAVVADDFNYLRPYHVSGNVYFAAEFQVVRGSGAREGRLCLVYTGPRAAWHL
jgi:hypothetical protein